MILQRSAHLVRVAGVFLLLRAAALFASDPVHRWQIDSFRAFSEGSLPDGGVNVYMAADGTLRLINAFDFNQDGLPDIFLPCNHAYGEKVDLSIYWVQPGYSSEHMTRLPTEGWKDADVADVYRVSLIEMVVLKYIVCTRTAIYA